MCRGENVCYSCCSFLWFGYYYRDVCPSVYSFRKSNCCSIGLYLGLVLYCWPQKSAKECWLIARFLFVCQIWLVWLGQISNNAVTERPWKRLSPLSPYSLRLCGISAVFKPRVSNLFNPESHFCVAKIAKSCLCFEETSIMVWFSSCLTKSATKMTFLHIIWVSLFFCSKFAIYIFKNVYIRCRKCIMKILASYWWFPSYWL